MGKSPANTRGLICLKPGRLSGLGLFSRVMVSPTGAPSISLMPAITKPTSPVASSRNTTDFGVNRPSLSAVGLRPVAVTLGSGDALDQRFEQCRRALPSLGADGDGLRRVNANDLLDLLADPVRIGRRQIDLVDD